MNRLRSTSNKHLLLLEWPSQRPTESVDDATDWRAAAAVGWATFSATGLGLTRTSNAPKEGRSPVVRLACLVRPSVLSLDRADARQESDSCAPQSGIGSMPFTKGCTLKRSINVPPGHGWGSFCRGLESFPPNWCHAEFSEER